MAVAGVRWWELDEQEQAELANELEQQLRLRRLVERWSVIVVAAVLWIWWMTW
jgi:hypothetical protein